MKFYKNKNLNKHYSKLKQSSDEFRFEKLHLKKCLKQKDRQINALNQKCKDLEKSNRRKLEYITYLAHEYRTPLTSIIGFTSLIEEEEIPRDKQIKFADRIIKASKYLLNLTNYTLNMAKAETDKVELEYSEFDPNEIIHEVFEILEEKIVKRHIKITFNLVNVHIIADKLKFKQLIYNFAGNAVKFNKYNGTIDIKTTICENNFYFEIKDSGKGILESEQYKIFEFFSNIDNHGLENEEATGIGLSMCKKIINLHKGEIDFSSKENSGTVFRFFLPVKASVVNKFYKEYSRTY